MYKYQSIKILYPNLELINKRNSKILYSSNKIDIKIIWFEFININNTIYCNNIIINKNRISKLINWDNNIKHTQNIIENIVQK